ncbi:MAG: DUF4845 domain-containing protein [Lysobacteraceae bacterium]
MIVNRNQRGMSLVGFLLVLSLFGFFAFLAMRLFPVYSEYRDVVSDMNGLKAEAGAAAMSPQQLRDRLFRRFYVSYVESVKPEHVSFNRDKGYNMTVKYEVRKPLMYNLDFVAKFEHSVNFEK